MAADPVLKVPCASSTNCDQLRADDNTVEVAFDTTTKLLRVGNRAGVRTLASLDGTETFTNKTITGGTFTGDPVGIVRVAGGVITELTGDGTYTISVTVPAGSLVLSIRAVFQAAWTAGTSATLTIGDTGDPDGFLTGGDAKSYGVGAVWCTDDDEVFTVDNGAYFTAAGVERGPVSTNFGYYYVASSIIRAAVVKSGTGTAGRTGFWVMYATPETVAQVVS